VILNRNGVNDPMQNSFGFPRDFLPMLRCVYDACELSISTEVRSDEFAIADGSVCCAKCARQYPIEDGIVRLMPDSFTEEDLHEITLRDQEYETIPDASTLATLDWRSEFNDRVEIPPHLSALKPVNGRRVLEIGCGDGRFTILMAQLGADVLAVDFSIEGLRKARTNLQLGQAPTSYKVAPLPSMGRVGLVQADATKFHVAPLSFDRAISATPLDGRDERMRMYRSLSESLRADGRYVAGVEYDSIQRRLLGLPLVRRYSAGGILIEHLAIPTLRREISPYFRRVRMRLIRARVPFLSRLRLPMAMEVLLVRICSALPGFRHLGEILLACAESPIKLPAEGSERPDFLGARTAYHRYKRWLGKETAEIRPSAV
jgi:SAM-dependent methyltransferase